MQQFCKQVEICNSTGFSITTLVKITNNYVILVATGTNNETFLLKTMLPLFTVISGHICFLLLVFPVFLHFLVVGSVR